MYCAHFVIFFLSKLDNLLFISRCKFVLFLSRQRWITMKKRERVYPLTNISQPPNSFKKIKWIELWHGTQSIIKLVGAISTHSIFSFFRQSWKMCPFLCFLPFYGDFQFPLYLIFYLLKIINWIFIKFDTKYYYYEFIQIYLHTICNCFSSIWGTQLLSNSFHSFVLFQHFLTTQHLLLAKSIN